MEGRLHESMPQEHKEIFERVWKRVMTTSREDCPIAWGEEAAAPVMAPAVPEKPEAAPPEDTTPESGADMNQTPETPKVPETPDVSGVLPMPCQDHPQGDFPKDEDMGVLGRACMDWVPLLQELIRRCLSEQREYLRLSRRAGGNPGRSFASMAREKQKQAKRLSAAYFLISGVKYWPQVEEPAPAGSYLGALRRRFRQEQTDMAACLAGAEGCTDPSLSQLFQEIAKEDWDLASRIRTLVEQA